MFKPVAASLSCIVLTACSSMSNQHVSTEVTNFYDYQLYSPTANVIDLTSLPQSIIDADVILVGEWHTHSGIHHFQTDLLAQLASYDRRLALSMEQFSRDAQLTVTQYLDGEIGEQVLIKQGNAWPNYESDYRPLVELAKSHRIDIIAANAPKPLVSCIGKQGLSYLDKIEQSDRENLARIIDTSETPYKAKFLSSMHHGKPEQTEKQYAAQITWDETMAESIVDYLQSHPNTQVMHIAGKFHIEQGLGTKASILKRNPNLKVVVITPSNQVVVDNSDYQLHVLPPPERYVQMENRMAAYKELSKRNSDLICL